MALGLGLVSQGAILLKRSIMAVKASLFIIQVYPPRCSGRIVSLFTLDEHLLSLHTTPPILTSPVFFQSLVGKVLRAKVLMQENGRRSMGNISSICKYLTYLVMIQRLWNCGIRRYSRCPASHAGYE